MANSQWWAKLKDGVSGPHTDGDLRRLALSGQVIAATEIHRGDGEWFPAGKVKGLFREIEPDFVSTKPETNLVGCPDCAQLVSPRATACVNCGCPLLVPQIAKPATMFLRRDIWGAIGGIIGAVVFVVGSWYGNSVSMIIGALLMIRAAIPTKISPD